MTEDSYDPTAHYDRVTEAWGLLLGEELHYGLFLDGDEDLATATGQLTARMIDEAKLGSGLRVLDVGCGTGAPACRLAHDHDVEVLGITTSVVGVERATLRAKRAGLGGVRFEVRDGTANGLTDASFDRAWVLESSHLMPDRQGLVTECARVLRPGGILVLCDVIRRREIPFAELRARRDDFAVLRAAFGAARMDTLTEYRTYAERAGLSDIRHYDITAETLPTFRRWTDNVATHGAEVTSLIGAPALADFARASQLLESFWKDGTLGYGLVTARRPVTI